MARLAAAALAACICLAALPAAAQAYRFAGPRWPSKTITVANEAPRYERAVTRGIRAWNRAGVGIRFRRAPRAAARVVIRYSRTGRGYGLSGCEGIAGSTGAGYPGVLARSRVVSVVATCRSARLRTLTIAHELGHVLGLGHENRRCALMNAGASARGGLGRACIGSARTQARRRRVLVLADDRRGVRRLYRRGFALADPLTALFNPGNGSRVALDRPVIFGAVVRNPTLTYRWSFGDPASGAANAAVGPDVRHAFARRGGYLVTLELIDGGTVVARRTQRVDTVCRACP